MLKNKRNIMIAVGVLLALAIIYFVFIRKEKDPLKALDTSKKEPKTDEELIAELDDSQFPLKFGSKGKYVEQVQLHMKSVDKGALPSIGVDGIWKDETNEWVKKLYSRDNISKDFFIKKGMYKIPTQINK